MRGAQEWPVAGEETAEERAFGYDEEEPCKCGDDMARGIEEEELKRVSYQQC